MDNIDEDIRHLLERIVTASDFAAPKELVVRWAEAAKPILNHLYEKQGLTQRWTTNDERKQP